MQTEGSGAPMNIILWTVMTSLREDVDIVTARLHRKLTECSSYSQIACSTNTTTLG